MRQRGIRSSFDRLRFAEILSFVTLAFQLAAYIAGFAFGVFTVPRFVSCLVASGVVQRYIASGFWRTAPKGLSVVGRLAVVTGANTGIGFETALDLSRRGCRVVLACRSPQRGLAAVKRIRDANPEAAICFVPLDLESQASVKAFVAALPAEVTKISTTTVTSDTITIDILVNNAGFYTDERRATKDGVEVVLAVNHVSAFLLTELLLPALKRSSMPSRVINLGSVAQTAVSPLQESKRPFSVKHALEQSLSFGYRYYGLSKLCNVMHAQYLAEKHGLIAVSVNPGGVLTEVFRNIPWVERLLFALGRSVLKTPTEGAQTTLHCCVAPLAQSDVENGSSKIVPGGFYADCRLRDDCRNAASCDPKELAGFVEWSFKACGL